MQRRTGELLDRGRAVEAGRPTDLLLRMACVSGGRGQAGSLLATVLPLLVDCDGLPYPPLAIVFGSGASVEALELLRAGWTVVAFDEASDDAPSAARLTIKTTEVGQAVLPPADLVYSAVSLPFRSREDFALIWARIVRALRPGGWFVGRFLGDQDSWANDPSVTVCSRDQVIRLLNGFRIEALREQDETSYSNGEKTRLHLFHVIARRRT